MSTVASQLSQTYDGPVGPACPHIPTSMRLLPEAVMTVTSLATDSSFCIGTMLFKSFTMHEAGEEEVRDFLLAANRLFQGGHERSQDMFASKHCQLCMLTLDCSFNRISAPLPTLRIHLLMPESTVCFGFHSRPHFASHRSAATMSRSPPRKHAQLYDAEAKCSWAV